MHSIEFLAEMGRLGGRARSAKKTMAARRNGLKGLAKRWKKGNKWLAEKLKKD